MSRRAGLVPSNPFKVFDDDHYLAALLRAWNSPNLNSKTFRPYLDELVALGYLKNGARYESSEPWWSLTPKGKALHRAFVDASFNEQRDEKEAFLRNTHGWS